MTPNEMARRIRHDLIKHLDIPQNDEILSPEQAGVLLRRIFDPEVGLCHAAAGLGRKMRSDEGWGPSLETPMCNIEKLCSGLLTQETSIRSIPLTRFAAPETLVVRLNQIVQAVEAFEEACCTDDSPSDEDAAMAFFNFSPQEERNEPRRLRILVVDDHTMSIDRMQAHPAFSQHFSWATTCHETCECRNCPQKTSCEKRRARTCAEAVGVLTRSKKTGRPVDAVLMDVRFDALAKEELVWLPNMPQINREEQIKSLQGLIIARQIRRMPEFSHIPIVLMTARARLPEGANSLLEGLEGLQFVDDDASLDALATRLENVIRMGREVPVEQGYFWGSSPRIQMIRRQLEIMSLGPRTVFITGPSGAGKSALVEQIIYPQSGRKKLVTLDLSSVPDTLVESELFGHVKGAYSGATHDRAGLIEEADGGILFLDEIGNLSLENQRKLLLFLQDKMIRRVGASHETRRHVDVKVVVATHLNLEDEVAAGRFRFDLLMRFGPAMRIVLPSLSERIDDLPELVVTLANKITQSEDMLPLLEELHQRTGAGGGVVIDFDKKVQVKPENLCIRFTPATRELFLNYSWPGNTRELESVLDTLILKAIYDLRVSGSKSRIIEIDHYYAMSLLGTIEKRAQSSGLSHGPSEVSSESVTLPINQCSDFAELRKSLEKQYLLQVFIGCKYDLARMGETLFGDSSSEMQHKITIRLNQLGLSLKKMKQG